MAQTPQPEAVSEAFAPGMNSQLVKDHILALGAKHGVVQYGDVLSVLPRAELAMDLLEDLFAALIDKGIDIGQVRDERPEEEEEEQDQVALGQDGVNDSTTLYLREIGRVALLTAKEEVQLAKRMEKAEEAKVRLNSPDERLS